MQLPWKRRHVTVTQEAVRVRRGLRTYVVRREDVAAVFTTMQPTDGDFREVVAVEFFTEEGGGVLVLDPTRGFAVSDALAALETMLGERWDDLYLGHKHLSAVRGLEPPE